MSGRLPKGVFSPSAARSIDCIARIVLPLILLGTPIAAAAEVPGVINAPCPPGAIPISPGIWIQAEVDHAGSGATFCLKNGIHRVQAIRPRPGQSFHGEGRTILSGSRLLTSFRREDGYWVANGKAHSRRTHGVCAKTSPACTFPEGLFIDDRPLLQVARKDDVAPGRFYLEPASGNIYFADDPTGRVVEFTVATFAFESKSPNVLIRNVIVEKYASVAQEGAIQIQRAEGWVVENCEVRLNSGAAIAAGTGTRIRSCNIHHNGQIGIAGAGRHILVEGNRIWENNIRGFDAGWEGGGVKIALGTGVVFRRNHVHDNRGPGLWCDGDCRDVVYEANVVERNQLEGIFHEISFNAVIRNNVLRNNGHDNDGWFWGNDILVAGSQDVEVYGNAVTVSPGRCGIMLIDQSRSDNDRKEKYKTRNNVVHHNEMTFEGAACAGGVSDAEPGDENYAIIEDGNNVFDNNIYRVPRGSTGARFPWGHVVLDWDGLRQKGLEPNGRRTLY
jgi:parallel beta helix pectate lyase-like protein